MLPTGDYQTDVRQPLYQQAEEKVMVAFRSLVEPQGWCVVDRRAYREHGDFWVMNNDQTLVLDVKCDQYCSTTHRLAWERGVRRRDGSLEPGWATSGHVDYVVFVAPQNWDAWVLNVPAWTAYVHQQEQHSSSEALQSRGWRSITKWNTDGRCALGWAIPLAELRVAGLIHRKLYLG